MGPVHIGHKVETHLRMPVVVQGRDDHLGTEIRSPDADIDHIGDPFPGVSRPFTTPDLVGKGTHFGEHFPDIPHDILAVDKHRPFRTIAQGRVQNRPVLGHIDPLPGKHRSDPFLDLAFFGQGQKEIQGGIRDPVLGKIKENRSEPAGKHGEPVRIIVEQAPHVDIFHLPGMGLEGFPGRGALHSSCHGRSLDKRVKCAVRSAQCAVFLRWHNNPEPSYTI